MTTPSQQALVETITQLQQRVAQLERTQRTPQLPTSALGPGQNITVVDEDGAVAGRIGWQPDGTVALTTTPGETPPTPSAPLLTPALGGLRVVWDGRLVDAEDLDVVRPADLAHVAVEVAPLAGEFSRVGTITQAGEGGMLPVVPLPYAEQRVRLVAVTTSGVAGDPGAESTASPLQVDGPDLTAGSVTAGTIAAGAVEADKLATILALVTRIVAGDPSGARVELNSAGLRAYSAAGVLTVAIDSDTGSAAFTGQISGSEITGSSLLVGDVSDEHIWVGDHGTVSGYVVRAAGGGALMEMAANASAAEMRLTPPPDGAEVFFEGVQYAFVATGSGFAYPAVAYTSPTTSDISPAGPSSEVQLEGGSTTVDASRVRHRADVHQFSMGVRTFYSKGVIEVDDALSIRADAHAPVSQDMLAEPDFATTGGFVDFDPADFPTIAFDTGYSGRVRITVNTSGLNSNSGNSSIALGFRLSGASTVGSSLKRCGYIRSIGAGTGTSRQTSWVGTLQLSSAESYTLTPMYRISSGDATTSSFDLALPNDITVEPLL